MPFDHSTMETLMRCEVEAVYRHVRHLTSPEESLASFFGRVVHEGVRVFYEAEKGVSGVGGGAPTSSNTQPQVEEVRPSVHRENAPNRHLGQGPQSQPAHYMSKGLPGVPVASAEAGLGSETTHRAESRPDSTRQGASPADLAAAACEGYWRDETESGRVRLAAASGSKPDHRTPELAAAIIRLYASLYGSAASRGYEVVMNERYLEGGRRAPGLPVSGGAARDARDTDPAPTEECGIIDRVVRRHADGLLYVLDLKTSSWAPNKGYWRQWSNSQQAAIYLDLVADACGEQPAGFWCDHIYVSGRKDGPRPEDFTQFGPVTYSEAKRQELRRQRAVWREKFAFVRDLVAAGGEAQQSTRSCYRYNSACPYLGYCSADPADRAAMIARDLQVGTLVERPWNPAGRDE